MPRSGRSFQRKKEHLRVSFWLFGGLLLFIRRIRFFAPMRISELLSKTSILIHFFYFYPATVMGLGGGNFGVALPFYYTILRFFPWMSAVLFNLNRIKPYHFLTFLPIFAIAGVHRHPLAIKAVVSGVIAFQTCMYLHSQTNQVKALKALLVAFFPMYFLQIGGIIPGPADYWPIIRFVGSLGGPNVCGGVMAMTFFFFIEAYREFEVKEYFWWAACCLFFMVATVSLGAVLTFGSIFCVYYFKSIARFLFRNFVPILAITCTLLLILYYTGVLTILYNKILGSFFWMRLDSLIKFMMAPSGGPKNMTGTFSYRIVSAYGLIERVFFSPRAFLIGPNVDHENMYLAILGNLGFLGVVGFAIPGLYFLNLLHKRQMKYIFMFPALVQAMIVPVWVMYIYMYFMFFLFFQYQVLRRDHDQNLDSASALNGGKELAIS